MEVRQLGTAVTNQNYEKRWLFRNLSFSLGKKEILGVIGPSGIGKTTLLRIIAGLEKHELGELKWDVPERFFGSKTCLMTQESAMLPWLSVESNMTLPQRLLGVRRQDAQSKIDQFLDDLGLAHVKKLRPSQLSGGMKQRVSFATSASIRPGVLLLDEPTSSLDIESKQIVINMLADYVRLSESAAIIVSHDTSMVANLADKVIDLANFILES